MTVFEALTSASEKLKTAQIAERQAVQNPKLDAQVLLSYVLNKPSAYLFAHGDEALSTNTEQAFLTLIDRRLKHEPIAYILGEKEFYKRTFKVSPATLIPRPETELLVDLALKDAKPKAVFADIGTGSGAIAVTLAAESNVFVFATDISKDALEIAKQNAATHNVTDKIIFQEGDLLLPFVDDLKTWTAEYKLEQITIVANLPYISKAQYETLDPDVKNYEPKTALVGGLDGLELYDHLLKQLSGYRANFPKAVRLLFEIDPSQERAAPALIKHYFPHAAVSVVPDLAKLLRVVEANL